MKKRVAIARALACSPEMILYDEPTAGLDPINTHLVNELICRLQKEERLTQVVVTHDLETAYRVADRLIMIHRGEKLFDGSVDMLKTADDPRIRTFLRPQEVLATPGCFPDKDGGIRVVASTMDEESPA
jgi:phospholipid/cholesterol/gamma-HCH transport system ATP-binding protein